MKPTHLKNIKNGRVFIYTENLGNRDDMIPCDAHGNIASGHVGDADAAIAGQERRKTAYLGNMTNGVLYPYTEYLAERDDMISIDTPEQWESMRETGEAPEQARETIAPTLSRATPNGSISMEDIAKAKEILDAADNNVPHETNGIALPDIGGMGAREAKTVLAEWAETNFKHKIDRRPSLEAVMSECATLLQGKEAAAG